MDTTPIAQQTKVCPKCGRTLSVECFSKNRKRPDGLQAYCKDCQRAIYNASLARHKDVGISYAPHVKGDPGTPLGNFTPRELREELQRRGFHGEFEYTFKVKI